MDLQGIKCRPYKFIHGNTKQISAMLKESVNRPTGLSHEIFPRLQPRTHCWSNMYTQLLILEPELIKEVLNDRDKASHKPEINPYLKKILRDGLTMSQAGKWAKMRKLASFAFHNESLKVSSCYFF
ncbi:Cytochrome P [Parasponia andersonii]|uniref:Cytochrome P n=1 Tax=Parasponia andersonii TaxID=3476 RepID=A0A2P5E2I9_PARAD|nr:Cytochrome P [Parasponia andersonii]